MPIPFTQLPTAGWETEQHIAKIYSAIVVISSAIVEISSAIVVISSELVQFSSELVSTIAELLRISTFKNTPTSESERPITDRNQRGRQLTHFTFIRTCVKTNKYKTSVATLGFALCITPA